MIWLHFWRCGVRYSATFGAPVLPIRVSCPIHTILSAPLHLHSSSFLLEWVTHTCCWHKFTRQLFWALGAHSTAMQARASMRKHCKCMHARSCEGMPVSLVCVCVDLGWVSVDNVWVRRLLRWGREQGRAALAKLLHWWCHT